MNTLLTLFNVDGIFCDALVNDDQDGLIFVSLWGRDTAIQELLARLTLSSAEGGIAQLIFRGQNPKAIHLGNPDRLDKLTGRMPKANIFGDMVQLWLFDKRVQEPDFPNQTAFLLLDERQKSVVSLANDENENAAWQLVKSVCQLPMLDAWRDKIIALLQRENWMKLYTGFCVNVIAIDLPETEFSEKISQMIIDGELTI
jgi:hypothetical protein